MPYRNFRELEAKMSPEARARSEAWARKALEEMPLHELRAARTMTQNQLAEALGITQAGISKLERRTDLYISTLSRFIEAMGGMLEIRAVFPDGDVRLTGFAEKGETA